MGKGIVFTKEGMVKLEDTILKAYFEPEQKEEIIKISNFLGIDLEELKDRRLKKFLFPENKKITKMIIVENCYVCPNRCPSGHDEEGKKQFLCVKTSYIIENDSTIPDWCRLKDAPEPE